MPRTIQSEEELASIAQQLSQSLSTGAILLLEGEIGVGKTTFTRYLCQALNVPIEDITSPTFTLVQQYDVTPQIYHIDLYRLDGDAEFDSIDIDYYLNMKNALVIIEWSEKLGERLPPQFIKLSLDYPSSTSNEVFNSRLLTLTQHNMPALQDICDKINFNKTST